MKIPKKWPVSLDVFLRLVVKRRHVDRRRIYKQFISEGMRLQEWMLKLRPEGVDFDDVPNPTAEQVESVVANHAKEGFTEYQFMRSAQSFARWEPTILRTRAQLAAKARWLGHKNCLEKSDEAEISNKHVSDPHQASAVVKKSASSISKAASSTAKNCAKHTKPRR